jgi:hypothetical protein
MDIWQIGVEFNALMGLPSGGNHGIPIESLCHYDVYCDA